MAMGVGQGTATAPDVLTSSTFSSDSGIQQAGTMPNFGAQDALQPGAAAIGPGYMTSAQAAVPGTGSDSWTTAGTYSMTVPSGVTRLPFAAYGPGGGGGSSSTGSAGAGGGGGGCVAGILIVLPGDTIGVTVGAGGAGGTSGNSGSAGTSSTLSINGTVVVTATAGSGGAPTSGGPGGNGSFTSADVVTAQANSGTAGLTSGSGAYGGAGAGPGSSATAYNAPGVVWGNFPAGGDGSTTIGGTGTAPGGGGAGQASAGTGGAGAAGAVYLCW